MKKQLLLVMILCLVTLAAGCGGGKSSSSNNSGYTGVAFKMVAVPGGLTFPTGGDDSGSATVSAAYSIGETEVTYELWSAVYTWAVSNGYSFANAGQAGGSGSGSAQQPVTTISWRDAIVWCNALTEYYNAKAGTGYTCVYRYNNSVVRDSRDSNAMACDGATQSPATGFRLPTSNEWELAARYINDSNNDHDICDSNEYYPGTYASGADAAYDVQTKPTIDMDGNGALMITSEVGVDGNIDTAVVKSKSPNKLGLYDMSGNVWEWCFDLDPVYSPARFTRGGSVWYDIKCMRLGFTSGFSPENLANNLGFRMARTR